MWPPICNLGNVLEIPLKGMLPVFEGKITNEIAFVSQTV